MATAKATFNAGKSSDFFGAVISELRRVVEQGRDFWTVGTRLPVVPHAAQLSLLGVLLLKGGDSGSDDAVFTHRKELEARLEKAYRASKTVWFEATTKKKPEDRIRVLGDSKKIRPAVMNAVKFAEKKLGRRDLPLSAFTDDVQDTLAELVGKFSEFMEAKLVAGKTVEGAAGVPGAVHAAIGLGMLAGGLAGRREMTPKEVSAARVLSRMGAEKDESGNAEPKPLKKLRTTLKELAAHLPEQRT